MENRKGSEAAEELSAWVRSRANLLAPSENWEPDLKRGRAHFETLEDTRWRRHSLKKRWMLAGAAASFVVVLGMLAVPQTSAFAEQAGNWGWSRLERIWNWITIVHTSAGAMSRMPAAMQALHIQQTSKPAGPWNTASAAEAARLAGFTPRLPDTRGFSRAAQVSVLGPVSFQSVIGAAELAEGVRKTGIGSQLPGMWDGARLTLQIPATVTAKWPGVTDERGGVTWAGLTLVQGFAPAVQAPAGFDLKALVSTALSAGGFKRQDTIAKIVQLPNVPAAILSGHLGTYSPMTVRVVSMHSRPAVLLEEFSVTASNGGSQIHDGPMIERITLAWTGADRFYVMRGELSAPVGFISPSLAAALTSMIDLADSIE